MKETQIRIGHFSPDAPNVNVLVDDEPVLEDVSFGTISDYLSIDAGSIDVAVVPASGGDAVIEATLDIGAEMDYTVLATGMLEDIDALVLNDTNETIEAGESRLRFVHLAPDAPAVDLTVIDGPTLFESIEFAEFGDYVDVDASAYDVEVLPAGSEDAVLTLRDLELDEGTTYTVFAIGTLAEDSLDAMLVEDFVGKKPAATR